MKYSVRAGFPDPGSEKNGALKRPQTDFLFFFCTYCRPRLFCCKMHFVIYWSVMLKGQNYFILNEIRVIYWRRHPRINKRNSHDDLKRAFRENSPFYSAFNITSNYSGIAASNYWVNMYSL